ncbi:angiopoietin-related protein 3 [Brienomyrus brachyistius]|uniref:angiopoietin-related protein 3 n=1 Tax=Brienomyrus brachyistius TaxID=42636 RepID=UPI0020B1EE28|nr:angiopoietin-related protein 3 [Brienomyrus brachyistius]
MKLVCLLVFFALLSMEAMPGETRPAAESKSRFAMLDDVQLLATGLLQLGQSLKEFVQKTKGQINDIFQKLSIFDRSFSQLSDVTNIIKEEEEELKKTTTFLKANNEEIKNLSLEINTKVDNILQERSQLQTKVGGLEEKLTGLSKNIIPPDQMVEITALKEIIETQEKNIQNLLKAVKEQHDQLDYQSRKIKNLEEKLSTDVLQETLEKQNSRIPEDLSEYLTNSSTNTSFHTMDLPADCKEVFNRGERNSGVYSIQPNQSEPFNVYCDIAADGGVTVIQRRQDGSVDFDQTWEKYENGFGDLKGEFWLGLEKIYTISRQGESILLVQLEDWKGDRHSMEYQFTLEGPSSQYTIHLQHAAGDSLGAMTNQTSVRFSTKDRNNANSEINCSQQLTGGWWFNPCGDANLNGKYIRMRPKSQKERKSGIHWKPDHENSCFLKTTKLSVRHMPH